jgi:hypothetical protein
MLTLLGFLIAIMMMCGVIGVGFEYRHLRPAQRASVRMAGICLALVGGITVAFKLIAVGL